MANLEELLRMGSTDTVSDELLAAYIDGNTTAEENDFIESSIPLGDINDIKELTIDSLSFEEQLHFYDGDYGYWELGIPPVLDINDSDNHLNEATMDRENYGYEPNYEFDKFDPDIFQGYNNTCAIRAQEIVMRDYGILIPQDQLVQFATNKGWFDPDPNVGGTDKDFVGNILDANGLTTNRIDGASINEIIAELKAGHRVIVSVDADELWVKKEPNVFKMLFGQAKNYISDSVHDFLGLEGANHALIVAGVNVNPVNPEDIKVVLIDSGTGDVCIEYDLKDFQDAWADGHCKMIATTIPAPFQYNYHTHELEPSGFDPTEALSNIHINEYFTNTFPMEVGEHMLASSSPFYSEENPIDWNTEEDVLFCNNPFSMLGRHSVTQFHQVHPSEHDYSTLENNLTTYPWEQTEHTEEYTQSFMDSTYEENNGDEYCAEDEVDIHQDYEEGDSEM